MRRTNTPAPPPVEAASAAQGKAEAIGRACKLAPAMMEVIARIAATPEPPRGAATRAPCAVETLKVAGLIAAGTNVLGTEATDADA